MKLKKEFIQINEVGSHVYHLGNKWIVFVGTANSYIIIIERSEPRTIRDISFDIDDNKNMLRFLLNYYELYL